MCAFYVGLWSISVIVFSAVQPGALAQVQFFKTFNLFQNVSQSCAEPAGGLAVM